MKRYNPKEIEPKWQKVWEETKINEAEDASKKPKRYILEYFPYPSGVAMHVGHVRNYAIGDVMTRYVRMSGYNVLHPMGWDAFGLPAERHAIESGISPQEAIKRNTVRFREQLTQMGFSYDWSREFASSDPEYYRWTQWFFLLLFKRGLAYQKESPQWWCPVDKTVLANEQVENGRCWRCGHEVEKKSLKQWFFKITDYADRLEKDLDGLDWSEAIKSMQRNWIGHKKGIEITYAIDNVDGKEEITCFTTRPDTNYGATFVVLAPEHPFVKKVIAQEAVPTDGASHWQAVEHYVQKALAKSEVERKEEGRLKTGAFTGFYVVNPLNKKRLPIWVSDFVLAGFGTGAVVGVPGHDMRDYQFAKEFGLPVERVVVGDDGDTSAITTEEQVQEKNGKMINSGPLDGLDIHTATEKMMDLMVEKKMGKRTESYSIRDWLISRQRYWGAPIPIVHCPKDGLVAVPEDQLPVLLPKVESYMPSGDGRSPLARVSSFVHTTCPKCGGPAERETDTMDGFACSSWYMWRFIDPHNDREPFSKERLHYWAPVDDYIGGAEHAVMHLLYVRFWTKVMFDAGILPFEEPIVSLRNHGMILAPDGRKMSKSLHNTIEPDSLIENGYGADSIRLMELFIGPWNQTANWSIEGLGGCFRFLQRVWSLVQEYIDSGSTVKAPVADEAVNDTAIARVVHKAAKKVSADIERMSFNTAIATLMETVNELYRLRDEAPFAAAHQVWGEQLSTVIQLLAPFVPHIAEELWADLGHDESVHITTWPTWDGALLVEETATIVVQVNGKVRANIIVEAGAPEAEVVAMALDDDKVTKHLGGKEARRVIFVPDKLLNLVV